MFEIELSRGKKQIVRRIFMTKESERLRVWKRSSCSISRCACSTSCALVIWSFCWFGIRVSMSILRRRDKKKQIFQWWLFRKVSPPFPPTMDSSIRRGVCVGEKGLHPFSPRSLWRHKHTDHILTSSTGTQVKGVVFTLSGWQHYSHPYHGVDWVLFISWLP